MNEGGIIGGFSAGAWRGMEGGGEGRDGEGEKEGEISVTADNDRILGTSFFLYARI